MTILAQLWQFLTTTRYTRLLEAEVELQRSEIARLRHDNRAFVNSMLIRGGYNPIEEAVETKPIKVVPRLTQQQMQRKAEREDRAKLPLAHC